MTDPITLATVVDLEVRSEEERIVSGRIVPYGDPIRHSRGVEEFAAGAFADVHPEDVPLLWHHDPKEPIGRMTSIVERDDGAFAEFRVADTVRGRDYLALARERVVAGLSIGFDPQEWETRSDGTRVHSRVSLREVSAVTYPAYAGAQITEVRESEERTMPDTTETTETVVPEIQTDPVEIREAALDELRTEIRQLRTELSETPQETRDAPTGFDVFQVRLAEAMGVELPAELRAIADVVADLGTADASGLTPDFYWAQGLKENVDARRPFLAYAGDAVFPTYGNNLVTGKITQEPTGQSGAAQKAAITSTALQVDPVTFPIVWHKIALDIAIELAEQGNPDALGVASRAMLRWYAKASDLDALTKTLAAATATGVAWSTLTDLGDILGALYAAGASIEDETGMFGNLVAMPTDDFGALMAMTGASGPWDADTPGDITVQSLNRWGFTFFRDGQATEVIQYNAESVRVGERNPIAVAATNVEKFGYDRGYIGATVVDLWTEGIAKHTV